MRDESGNQYGEPVIGSNNETLNGLTRAHILVLSYINRGVQIPDDLISFFHSSLPASINTLESVGFWNDIVPQGTGVISNLKAIEFGTALARVSRDTKPVDVRDENWEEAILSAMRTLS